MAKHNWQTTERMCIYCGAVIRRDIHPCRSCGGNLEWNAVDLVMTAVGRITRVLVVAVLVPVLLYLFGTVSPLQVVIERNPAAMRANGACIIAMPVVKALIQIQPNCPVPHTALPFPSQLRTVLLAWDAVRSAPWAFGIVTVYDEVFMYVDAFIGWIAATVTPE
jgi:hypothetical protein